jgi:hypothetical protein
MALITGIEIQAVVVGNGPTLRYKPSVSGRERAAPIDVSLCGGRRSDGTSGGCRVTDEAFSKGCEQRDRTSTGWARLNAGVETFATLPLTANTWRG